MAGTEAMGNRAWVLGGLILLGIVAAGAVVRWFLGSSQDSRREPTPVSVDEPPRKTEPTPDIGSSQRLEAHPTGSHGEPTAQDIPGVLPSEADEQGTPISDPGIAESTLEQVSRTFLTENPDLIGFDRLLGDLAERAVVVPGSITVDERSGVLTGKMQLGDGLPEAEFQIDGESYRVAWTTYATATGRDEMALKTLDVHFGADSAGIHSAYSCIQFHPDTRRHASEFLAAGEEHYVGWAVRQAADGNVSVDPIAMRAAADGLAWEIGKPLSLASHAAPWAAGLGAAQALHQKLAAVQK